MVRTPLVVRVFQTMAFYPLFGVWQTKGGVADYLVAAIFAVFISAAAEVFKPRYQEEQRWRDDKARNIVQAARDRQRLAIPYILYLRSFSTTGKLAITGRSGCLAPWGTFTGTTTEIVELESVLVDSFWGFAPVVALGTPREHFGAGRESVTDDEWEGIVEFLAVEADTILMLPGITSGLEKEYSIIKRHDLMPRTVFVMPPSGINHKDSWERASDFARLQVGVDFPAYKKQGLLFLVEGDGQMGPSVDLPASMTMGSISRRLRKLKSAAMASSSESPNPAAQADGSATA